METAPGAVGLGCNMLPRAGFKSLIPRPALIPFQPLRDDADAAVPVFRRVPLSSLLLSLPPFPLLFEQGTSGGILTG